MSEYAPRETSRQQGGSTTATTSAPPQTASERAAEAVIRVGREVDSVSRAIRTLKDATEEPREFLLSKDAIVHDLERAETSLAAVRARQQDVPPELLPRLSNAEVSLGMARAELSALREPKRWRNVAGEENLLAILAQPVIGAAGPAWEAKERELKSALAELSPAECRVLSERVRKATSGDPIVTAFARMVPQRRLRLLAFLDDARRREAIAPRQTTENPVATNESAPKLKHTAFGNYVRINVTDIGIAIAGHLKSVPWPDPSSDVAFAARGAPAFVNDLSASLLQRLDGAEELPLLLHPSDIVETFQQMVPDSTKARWFPTFGLALAQAVEATAKAALRRLAPRYHQALLQRRQPPGAGDLTASHPIDPLVASAMVRPGVLSARVDEHAASSKISASPRENARVERWLGRQHLELWNFVQVSPVDATVEEVAATLWADPAKSTMAIALRKYADVFRVEPAYARKLISDRYRGEVVGHADVDNETQIMALARSELRTGDAPATELAHAATDAPSAAQLAEIEHDIGVRLEGIRQTAASLGMSTDLATAYGARTARLGITAGADAAARARWLPVLQFQHTQLISLGPIIATLASQLAGLEARTPAERSSLAEILMLYIRAAAVSHLRDESTALVRTAKERELRGTRRLLDAAQREVFASTIEVEGATQVVDAQAVEAAQRTTAARTAALDGQTPHDQEEVLTLAGEVSLRSRMRAAEHSLARLYASATETFGDPIVFRRFFPNVKMYPELVADVRAHLADVQRAWTEATRAGTPQGPADPHAPPDRAQWQGRSAGLSAARTRFAQIAGDQSISDFLREGQEKVQHQQFVNALIAVGANLLINVATGMGAAAIGKTVATTLVGEAAVLAGSIGAEAIQGVTSVAINSAVQYAMSGGEASIGWTLLENSLMELFTRTISVSISRVERAAAIEGRELAELPHLAAAERAGLRGVDFAGARLLADSVGGFAAQWAANRIVQLAKDANEPDAEPFAITALQQGAAIGLGRFFHGRVEAWTRHRAALERMPISKLPEMRALFAERDAFHETAAAAAVNPSPEPALADQLASTEAQLVERETALLKSHPELMTSGGAVGHGDRGEPVRTPWGDVWPGDVPAHAPAEQKEIFAHAAEIFHGLANDGFQGGGLGRVRWAEYLGAHGIALERELLAKLQLGGDSAYLHARLRELEAVFPGASADVAPMVEQRAARRDSSAAKHQQMETFRAERLARQTQLTQELLGQKVISTKRLVVGDGFSGLADVASLGFQKQGEWIAPSDLLVFGGPDLIAQLATNDPSFRWGQRAATYDRAVEAHPAFSDAEGRGRGDLGEIVEDPGEFMHVGEVRDSMDQARKRLGILAVDARVVGVEHVSDGAANPPWEADAQLFPFRVEVLLIGEKRFVYVDNVDLAPGPGKPRMPNESILSPTDRAQLIGKSNGEGVLFSGEKLLEGKTASMRGKRVLVMAFGPTGAWTAVVAAKAGAARVDFAGSSGSEAGMRGHNPNAHANMSQIDRVQDALQGNDVIHTTMDRIVHIEPAGEGAVVTYAHGFGESPEVYEVHYDAIINSLGYTTNADAPGIPGEPTVKEMLGKRKMIPQKGSTAPTLQDETGHIRVIGFAAGDNTNVEEQQSDGTRSADADELKRRKQAVKDRTSADSPDERVVEGVGLATRDSNEPSVAK